MTASPTTEVTSPAVQALSSNRKSDRNDAVALLEHEWATAARWAGIDRTFSAADVVNLRGSVVEEHTLARLGAVVTAVDKSNIDPMVAALPGVSVLRESAFALPPQPVDWLFSDVVAYPDRLLALVRRWIASGQVRRIVCTVKFQGETDHDAAAGFAAIPGGQLMHLFHNKHELTFAWGMQRRTPGKP